MGDQMMNAESQGFPNEVFSDSLDEAGSTFGEGGAPRNPRDDNLMPFNKVFLERPSEVMDQINLARTLFDLKEYRKCANLLSSVPSSN
jgi:hypothetical protein